MKFRLCFFLCNFLTGWTFAQTPPSSSEIDQYEGLFAAVAKANVVQLTQLVEADVDLESRDAAGRTPLLVATHFSHDDVAELLLKAGADANALDHQRYDLITIAAVKNDVGMIQLGLRYGASPTTITSPYDGTALIAASHLGHVETVRVLISAGAPLDHLNNLHWTAVIEAIVLGDGGKRHAEILKLLLDAGASAKIADRQNRTPLVLAKERGYDAMVDLLQRDSTE